MPTGIPSVEDTRVVHGEEYAVHTIASVLHRTCSRWDACVDHLAPSLSTGELKKMYLEARKKGVEIRYITDITPDNLAHCKEMMKVAEVRHFAGVRGNFAVSDGEYVAGIRDDDSGRLVQCIYSNVKQLVRHHGSIFEMFWQSAVSAESRVREIEEGITLSVMETIHNPIESLHRAYAQIQSARQEVFIMFSTPNAVRRHLRPDRVQSMRDVVERKVRIKVLLPSDEGLHDTIKEIQKISQIQIRSLDKRLRTKVTILVIDGKESFIFETKDDSKDNPYDAIGRSAHSVSDAVGLSFAAIFESIWNQSELYEKLKEVDSMKDDFINIAAHELRTPVLPIVLSAENLAEKMPDDENVKIILRNTNRIRKLTNDILDVSRIGSRTLGFRKEEVDIKSLCEEVIQDALSAMPEDRRQAVRISLESDLARTSGTFDKERIRQVLANLLDNAVKFTRNGAITIRIDKSSDYAGQLQVRVIDTGTGIDEKIKEALFEKFVTKSETAGGSGLGLYISKGIVEAHGGRIWASNNGDGRGATFTFTLPLPQP